MSTFLENLPIERVKQTRINEVRIDIDFIIGDFLYQLTILKSEHGIFYPDAIYHVTNIAGNKNKCSICGNNGPICADLTASKNKLFQHLIQSNSIRFEWLFIPHAEGEK